MIKEEILKKLLKDLLDDRLKRLEKRNLEQMKDIKLEKETYNKQGILVKKLCSIKIEPKNSLKRTTPNNSRLPGRSRDKTPSNIRPRGKNLIKDDEKKVLRSKTPNTTVRRPRKDQKEKNDNLKKPKIPSTIKTIKNTNNSKIPSYMANTSSNMTKNRKINNTKLNNNKNQSERKAKTPDVRNKNKITRKKAPLNKEDKTISNNNLKLVDLKIEDMKEFIEAEPKKIEIKEEVKEEIKEEEKKEEKIEKKSKFEPLMGNNKIMNKIMNTLSSFLDEHSQYNLFSSNKKLSKYLYEKLMTILDELKAKNNISSSSTIQDQINSLKLKYKNEELMAEAPQFTLSKGSTKAIELLNNGEQYNKIFHEKNLKPPQTDILLVYRIFFQMLKDNSICKIKDDKLFWMEASDYILKNNNDKTGEFFKESVKNFDFSIKNIYEVKKIVNGNEDKIKPSTFSKICGTTGLIIFLIKDTLEYMGVIHNSKKSIPILQLKYLEYIGEIQQKMEKFINDIKKMNNNA